MNESVKNSFKLKDMFLRSAIEKILNDKEIKKSQHAQLRKAAEFALEELNAELAALNKNVTEAPSSVIPNQTEFVNADGYFLPFELACQSKTPRLVVLALDCLQKLIAHDHLTGQSLDTLNPERRLIDRIVECICAPFTGPNTDDAVQLQIIKALLTVVSKAECEAHDASLLLIVRTCFNIYLASKNKINQSTANAALTQILSLVFNRMEASMTMTVSVDDATATGVNDEEIVKEVLDSIVNQVSETSTTQSDEKDSDSHSLTSQGQSTAAGLVFAHVLQKDAFLLFRALCRLSMKAVPDNADPKSHEVRSRVLSLRLLLSVLQCAGPVFRAHDVFVVAIKQYLCVALSKNGVSTNLEVFECSLAIFLALIDRFKQHLKVQIEVFFKEIVLNILESSTASYEHKWMVMQLLTRICSDTQCVVDIYVNYDCDLTAANIFKRLVECVSRYAQGGNAVDLPGALPQQEHVMRVRALQCLVSILKCMVEWSNDLYITPDAKKDLASDTASEHHQSSSSTHSSTINLNSSSTALEFEQQKQQKDIMEHGIMLFNRKPKQGLAYMQQHNLVGTEPKHIAIFFMNEERLDKAVVGDFLGDGEQYCKDVMYAYVDLMDFRQKDFVAALRQFLEGFRLPGEAQKIDRLMEKFASRYCDNNSSLGIFASADTAYVLAYSIIMLTTDLHSSQVKNKMSKEQYTRMNRGINDSADLPEQYLNDIYDEIAGNEIRMKATTAPSKLNKQSQVSLATERERRLLHNIEMEQMAATARALMEAASHVRVSFTQATHSEHVRPMFKTASLPCLAVFSVALQGSDDHDMALLCLDGVRCAIRIACIFRMENEREAYVQALVRFTLLTAKQGMTEMKSKNIDTIKTLITVAHTDGNYLESSWYDILKCISQLELAQLLGTGVKHSTKHLDASSAEYVSRNSGIVMDKQSMPGLQEALGETSSQMVVVAVDRIFSGSVRLDGDAAQHFVAACCSVSMEELANPAHPRMFMLQKIVELSYYNMGRIRLQWSRIWQVLGDHFNKAGCNASEEVAFFAVDSLRQLSVKFIERGELPNFRFQKDFMRPFEYIMKRNRSVNIRDMVCRCMQNMVSSHCTRIRSGWKNVFSVFTIAASGSDQSLVEMAFNCTNDIIAVRLDSCLMSVLDSFQDAIKCLSEFACNSAFPDISMEAIRLIRLCARTVAEKPEAFYNHNWEDSLSNNSAPSERVWLRGWLPIMFELSCIISRCKLDVRTRSLTVLFEIMKTYGEHFEPHWWRDLFQVAFRIFDIMKLPEQQTEKAEWMMTTCNHALYAIVDVFTQYYHALCQLALPDLYNQLYWCVQQDNEQLARSAINCLENFVVGNGDKMDSQVWQATVDLLVKVFACTMPHDLLTWVPCAPITTMPSYSNGGTAPVDLNVRSLSHDMDTDLATMSTEHLANANGNGTAHAMASPPHSPNTPSTPNSYSTVQHVTLTAHTDQDAISSDATFHKLLIGCVVQLELVECVHSIVFGPSSARRDDKHALATSVICSPTEALNESAPTSTLQTMHCTDEQAMYGRLDCNQLFALVDCLLGSHLFAKQFNMNSRQRTLLWKAGFKGRTKPNLVRQEMKSLRTALKILFRMYLDETTPRNELLVVQNRLISVCREALGYYIQLTSEQHRDAWMHILFLILEQVQNTQQAQVYSRLLSLRDVESEFEVLGSAFSDLLVEVIDLNVRPEIRTMLKHFVQRCMKSFKINA